MVKLLFAVVQEYLWKMPFAWMGYGYTLNGGTYGNIDWNNIQRSTTVPLAINPYGLKDTVTKYGGASRSSTREIDIVDNNFKLPRVWRTNVAVDYKFGKVIKQHSMYCTQRVCMM